MFTKNFYNMLVYQQFMGTDYPTIHSADYKSPLSITSFGTTYSNYYCLHSKILGVACTSMTTNKYGVVFGTDGTPVSENDYTFANGFISGISVTVSSESGTQDDTGITLAYEYVVVNNNSDNITVREVGIWWKGVLLERTVLDTPVTIEPGGFGKVTYNIRYNCRLYT